MVLEKSPKPLTVKNMEISFEFFPARDSVGEKNLWESFERLKKFHPKFVSVTFGAGGGERDKTDDLVQKIKNNSLIDVAGHLTCVDMSKDEINTIATKWLSKGINKIVALRGDVRKEGQRYKPHPSGYINAADMVRGIKKIGNFEIAVAGYPEKHPESKSIQEDIENLKKKIDNGADKIITQFFFNTETFLKFRDLLNKSNINVPLIPGILPVSNYEKVKNFSKKCGTMIPDWIKKEFEEANKDPDIEKLIGISLAADLVKKLQKEGVTEFHFYTLNKYELTYAVCTRLLSYEKKNLSTKKINQIFV